MERTPMTERENRLDEAVRITLGPERNPGRIWGRYYLHHEMWLKQIRYVFHRLSQPDPEAESSLA